MQSKIILITGCSTGIGYDAALTLSKRGHRVFAACRKLEDVERLIALGLESVQMDVTSSDSIAHAFAEVMKKTQGRLDVLINNAGYAQAGALEDLPFDILQEQFTTNVFGLMDLTRLAIPVMRQQKQGRIINISSVLGVVGLTFHGAYVASKYALEGLSDTLRLELAPAGIDVITIEPGPVTSRFKDTIIDHSLKKIDVTNSYFHYHYDRMLTSYRTNTRVTIFTQGTHLVTRKLIHAIETKRPKLKYPVTFMAYFCILAKRIFSNRVLDGMMGYFSRKTQQTIYRS